jgi:hypothetical protein
MPVQDCMESNPSLLQHTIPLISISLGMTVQNVQNTQERIALTISF